MADENKDDKGNKGGEGGSGGESNQGGGNKGGKGPTLEQLAAEKDELVAEIRGLRAKGRDKDGEVAALQKRLDDIEKDKAKEQGKYKDLYEQSESKLKTVEGQWRAKFLRAEVKAAAKDAGILDLDVAGLINIDSLKDLPEGDLDEAVADLVAAHKTKKPNLYKKADGNEGGGEEGGDGSPRMRQTGSRERRPAAEGQQGQKGSVRDLPPGEYAERRRQHLREIRNSQRRG
jgi:hypothetical protein